MSLFVKLCGMSDPADLELALEVGADAVGFVLTPSPRRVTIDQATRLMSRLSGRALGVAVFHAPSPDLLDLVASEMRPDLFQAEPETLVGVDKGRILPVVVDGPGLEAKLDRALESARSGMVLVDSAAKGGTGRTADWERLGAVETSARVVLAGGLGPGNVAEAVAAARPFGVDVSSGIERSPGVKDPELMRAFVTAARHMPMGARRSR